MLRTLSNRSFQIAFNRHSTVFAPSNVSRTVRLLCTQQPPAPSPPPAPSTPLSSASTAAPKPAAATAEAAGEGAKKWNIPFPKLSLRTVFLLFSTGLAVSYFYGKGDVGRRIMMRSLFPPGKAKFFLKVERLDEQIIQYQTACVLAEQGEKAAMKFRMSRLQNGNLAELMEALNDTQRAALTELASTVEELNKNATERLNKIVNVEVDTFRRLNRLNQLREELLQKEKHPNTPGPEPSLPESFRLGPLFPQPAPTLANVEKDIQALEDYIQQVTKETRDVLGVVYAREASLLADLVTVLESNPTTAAMLQADSRLLASLRDETTLEPVQRPLMLLLNALPRIQLIPPANRARVYVLDFRGNVMAGQVHFLREEITAILTRAKPHQDEVLIRLTSGGGTVTGYGLAAAQIARLKAKGIKVKIAVDEVAASGGYLMAALADTLYCSPFAMIGSIGVIQTMPNFSERLTREGISVEDVTAGKYKRTLTPYKKPTAEDRAKVQEDIQQVLDGFKAYVKTFRPKLDVDKVATGEVWMGVQAKDLGLVDTICTSDDVLSECLDEHKEVYLVQARPAGGLFADWTGSEDWMGWDAAKAMVMRWIREAVVQLVMTGGERDEGGREAAWMAGSMHPYWDERRGPFMMREGSYRGEARRGGGEGTWEPYW